jgi:hypothetical protein
MFKYIDKPVVPNYLIELIRKIVEEHQVEVTLPEFEKMQIDDDILAGIIGEYQNPEEGLGVPFDTAYKYEDLANFKMIQAKGELMKWVTQNVASNHCGVHLQVMTEGKYVFPHVDMLRTRVWNYLIDTGDADTCFYKPKLEYEHLSLVPRTYVPYERVDRIQTIKIEPHRWHELDVSKIHGVENIKSPRLSISVSFVD